MVPKPRVDDGVAESLAENVVVQVYDIVCGRHGSVARDGAFDACLRGPIHERHLHGLLYGIMALMMVSMPHSMDTKPWTRLVMSPVTTFAPPSLTLICWTASFPAQEFQVKKVTSCITVAG